MILQMAQLLPKFPNAHFVIYIDNYFTSILLFSMLQKENIGAVGTTQPLLQPYLDCNGRQLTPIVDVALDAL